MSRQVLSCLGKNLFVTFFQPILNLLAEPLACSNIKVGYSKISANQ